MFRSEILGCQLLRTWGILNHRRIIWSPFGRNVRNLLLLGTSFSNNIYSSRWKWKAPYVKSFLQSFLVREEINSTCHICSWTSQVGFYHSFKWFTKLSCYQLKEALLLKPFFQNACLNNLNHEIIYLSVEFSNMHYYLSLNSKAKITQLFS